MGQGSQWSESLVQTSVEVLEELLAGTFPGAYCNLKRKVGQKREFGRIKNEPKIAFGADPVAITVYETNGERSWTYSSIDELIHDGWAVD